MFAAKFFYRMYRDSYLSVPQSIYETNCGMNRDRDHIFFSLLQLNFLSVLVLCVCARGMGALDRIMIDRGHSHLYTNSSSRTLRPGILHMSSVPLRHTHMFPLHDLSCHPHPHREQLVVTPNAKPRSKRAPSARVPGIFTNACFRAPFLPLDPWKGSRIVSVMCTVWFGIV